MSTAFRRFAPPLALMALIYFLSSRPNLSSGLDYDTVLRKGAHMTEYGLLWFLWWRALRYRHPGLPIAIALAYAATDEWHQAGVQGRHGTPVDVAIDAAGVALGALALRWWVSRPRSARSRAPRRS